MKALREVVAEVFGQALYQDAPMKVSNETTPEEVTEMATKKSDKILNTLMEGLALNAEHMRQAIEGLNEGEELVQRKWVVIRYTTIYNDGTEMTRNRKVIPVQLFESKAGDLCVVAYDDYRKKHVTFRLDKISAASLDREAPMFRKPDKGTLIFANSPKAYWKKPEINHNTNMENVKAAGFGLYPVAEILRPELSA